MNAKRILDLTITLPAIVVLAPVMLGVALAVRIALGPGVFFRQERPGLFGAPFTLVKFRTMRRGDGPDAERLTPFGRFLRASSLDELPELFNVLRGEMSLVGPRPLLMEYLPLYTPEQARRHETLPGVTGWAQVNGRNAVTWEERLAMDVWYVDHHSLGLDLRILARTFAAVLRREGVHAPGSPTMPRFTGSRPPRQVERDGQDCRNGRKEDPGRD